MPTSMMPSSAGTREKARNASAVVMSKKEIGVSPLASSHSVSSSSSTSSSINSLATRMRSLKRTRCGEV